MIAGKIGDAEGPIKVKQPAEFYDFKLSNTSYGYDVKPNWNCIVYVYDGELIVDQEDSKT